MSIKQMVRDDNMAEFEYYIDGNLWYSVTYYEQDMSHGYFKFPVPISDIGNATFNRTERAILLMRYIRKHLETLERARNEVVV